MLKKILLLSLSLMAASAWSQAATLNPYLDHGCQYQGDVGQDNKPHGKGVWQCNDGRVYDGQFQNGVFHGKGNYHIPAKMTKFLDTFGTHSTYLNNATLHGQFEKGRANGDFDIVRHGEIEYVITFNKGIMQAVNLPKKATK